MGWDFWPAYAELEKLLSATASAIGHINIGHAEIGGGGKRS